MSTYSSWLIKDCDFDWKSYFSFLIFTELSSIWHRIELLLLFLYYSKHCKQWNTLTAAFVYIGIYSIEKIAHSLCTSSYRTSTVVVLSKPKGKLRFFAPSSFGLEILEESLNNWDKQTSTQIVHYQISWALRPTRVYDLRHFKDTLMFCCSWTAGVGKGRLRVSGGGGRFSCQQQLNSPLFIYFSI